MNCTDVQNALWLSEFNEEIRKHLQECPTCQEEQQMMGSFFSQVEKTPLPVPSRSFLPSELELKSSLRFYKQRRVRKWLGRAAVVACVAVAMSPILNRMDHVLQSPTPSITPAQRVAPMEPANINVTFGPTNDHPYILVAVSNYLVSHHVYPTTSQIKILSYKPNVVETDTSTAGLVLLDVDGQQQSFNATFAKVNDSWQLTNLNDLSSGGPIAPQHSVPIIVQAAPSPWNDFIRAYLSKIFYGQQGVKQVTFEKFTPDQSQSATDDTTTVTGTLSLAIQLEPNAHSSYQNGPLQMRVKVVKQQDIWTVSGLNGASK